MKKIFLLSLIQIVAFNLFSQTIYSPRFSSSNMGDHTIEKVVISSFETVIHFKFNSIALPNYDADCGSYTCFTINKGATITTNTGQILKLVRCENLTLNYDGLYHSKSYFAGNLSWRAVFSKVDENATSITFQENDASSGSYFMADIELKRNVDVNSSSIVGQINNSLNSLNENLERNSNTIRQQQKATLQFYNNTPNPLYAAYAYYNNANGWTTEGWYKLESYTNLDLDLGNYSGKVYIHAFDRNFLGLVDKKWGGGYSLCIDPDKIFP